MDNQELYKKVRVMIGRIGLAQKNGMSVSESLLDHAEKHSKSEEARLHLFRAESSLKELLTLFDEGVPVSTKGEGAYKK